MLNRKYEINTQKILITLDKYKSVSRCFTGAQYFSFPLLKIENNKPHPVGTPQYTWNIVKVALNTITITSQVKNDVYLQFNRNLVLILDVVIWQFP
jgi:hypothetical protein